MLLGLMVVAALAEPEPKAEPSADPQYRKYDRPAYPKPAYPSYKPDYPAYKPDYPAYKPAYEPYPKPAYGGYPSYKKDYYCDPRAPPKCVQHNVSLTYCLSDYEYPEYDVQVIHSKKVLTAKHNNLQFLKSFSTPSTTIL